MPPPTSPASPASPRGATSPTNRRGQARREASQIEEWLTTPVGQDEAESGSGTAVNAWIHSELVARALDVLLFIDIFIVVASVMIEVQFLKTKIDDLENACLDGTCAAFHDDHHAEEEFEEMGDHSLEELERQLVYVSVAILCVFLAENLLLLAANGPRNFFSHPFQVFDLAIVVTSLALELSITLGDGLGIIVIGRAWRFIRIGHGVFVETEHFEERVHDSKGDKGAQLELSTQTDRI
uniref:Voltage-gated hydrogen channel 1 n=1 Tax=Phaeomonas parva TaxID=124430 RepID=A0A7S1UH79_9STRA|mmetsp:Transcript_5770/g.16180  ORF Transcript_5770/g.16180 Transcript_5770/m.16180 type:complete len:239 (+) Transcript_5770:213-929(+)